MGLQQKTGKKKKKTEKINKNPCVENWSKLVLKLVQVCCATKLDQFNTRIGSCFFLFFFVFLFFVENSLLSAGRARVSKTKNHKKTNNLDQSFNTGKANIGPAFNSTTYIYMPESY